MKTKLAETLLRLMDQTGATAEQLGQASGIEAGTVQQILRGEIERPPDQRLRGFAELLGVSFDSLLALIPSELRETASLRFDRATCAVTLAAVAPDWVQLLPLGELRPKDGRGPWKVSDPKTIIAASLADFPELPIDYDHQTDRTDKGGEAAPAAGWIVELQARDDGIWGRVEWTERGRASVAGREYRFISPAFIANKKTGEVMRLLRAGLTNDPALNLKVLASAAPPLEEEKMDEFLKTLRKILGLAEDADEKAVCAAVTEAAEKAKAEPGAQLVVVAKALGLKAEATADEIETAAAQATATAAKAGDRDELAARVAQLEKTGTEEKATAAVDGAVKAGKITPAQRDWALDYAAKDPEAFATFLEKQPVVLASGGRVPAGSPPKGGEGLTSDELAYCNSRGIAAEDYKKSQAQILGRNEGAA